MGQRARNRPPAPPDEARVVIHDGRGALTDRAEVADSHRRSGRTRDANAAFEALAADCEKELVPDDELTLWARVQVGACHIVLGPTSDQLGEAERLLADCERVLGADEQTTVAARTNLALTLSSVGRAQEAVPVLERAVEDCRRVLGPSNPDTFAVRIGRVAALRRAGRTTEALRSCEEVIAEAQASLGADDLLTLGARHELALAYRAAGRAADAEVALRQLHADAERVLDGSDPLMRAVAEDLAILAARRNTENVYTGPYVAAAGHVGGSPWVWVANGTKPLGEKFSWPRSVSERAAMSTGPLNVDAPRVTAGSGPTRSEEADGPGERLEGKTWATASGNDGMDGGERVEELDGEVAPMPTVTEEEASDGTIPVPAVADEEAQVELRFLGPVEGTGWRHPPDRAVVIELACYLGLHRHRAVHGDELRVALRPAGERELSAATLRSYVSLLRRALGPRFLPSAVSGGYLLADGVVTDWERFVVLSAPGASRDKLCDALSLVRGRPFEGVADGSYEWIYAELLVSDMEVRIASAARRLAEVARETDDLALAGWAVRQGLGGAPNDVGLWQLHVEIAAHKGEAALERARREAAAALGADDLLGPMTPSS